jgi:predicted Zn-dependent protease
MAERRFFYNLGRALGPKIRTGRWVLESLTGTEANAIQAEYAVGKDLATEISHQVGMDPEGWGRDLVCQIGEQLSGRLANKVRRFAFDVLHGEEPNACALPGGFVFVTRALLELCDRNADETAFVLGHEMGHVMKGHAIERFITNGAMKSVSLVSPLRGLLAGWLRQVGLNFLTSAYSREMELDADNFGMRLAASAGYDARAAVRLLQRLGDAGRQGERPVVGEYFSSHPPVEVRIQALDRLLSG